MMMMIAMMMMMMMIAMMTMMMMIAVKQATMSGLTTLNDTTRH